MGVEAAHPPDEAVAAEHDEEMERAAQAEAEAHARAQQEAAAAAAAAHQAAVAAAAAAGMHHATEVAPPVAAAPAAVVVAVDPNAAAAVAAAAAAAAAAEAASAALDSDDPGDLDAPSNKGRKDFEFRLKELKRFKLKHGHLNVPHKYPLNPQLGTWVDTQRRQYRASKRNPSKGSTLSQENVQRLLDVGFNFEPRLSREETWQTRVTELGRYRDRHGHCNVREDDRDWPGLGKWVSYIRRQFRLMRAGRRSKESKRLNDERIDQLRDMGFVFELREEMAQRRFREGLDMLRAFRAEHGHVDVPQFYPKNPTLGLCVQELRKEYRKLRDGTRNPRESALDPVMIGELREVGFFAAEDGGDEAAAALQGGLGAPPAASAAAASRSVPLQPNEVAEAAAAAAAAAAHVEAAAAPEGHHPPVDMAMQVDEAAKLEVPDVHTESV